MAQWVKSQENSARILIVTNNEDFFRHSEFEVVHLQNEPSLEIALQILVPVRNYEKVEPFLSKTAHNLLLFEYGYGSECPEDVFGISSRSFGLSENELGIFIHDDLRSAPFDNFEQLSPGLREKILKLNRTKEPWKTKWKMYSGSSHSEQALVDFIYAIAKLNSENSYNLLIILPGVQHLDLNPYLESFSFGSLTTQRYDMKLSTSSKKIFDSDKKEIFVLYGNFKLHDKDQIIIYSEPETIVAADDSLSKAISLKNKLFIYTEGSSEQTLGTNLKKNHAYLSVLDYTDPRFNTPQSVEMYKFFKEVNKSAFFAATESLIKTKNCQSSLLKLFNKALGAR